MKDISPANVGHSVKEIKIENTEEDPNIPKKSPSKKREIEE